MNTTIRNPRNWVVLNNEGNYAGDYRILNDVRNEHTDNNTLRRNGDGTYNTEYQHTVFPPNSFTQEELDSYLAWDENND